MTRNEIMGILYNYRKAQLIHVAARLNIAELLDKKRMNIEELARETEADKKVLFRVMRALLSIKIFRQDESGLYSNNENSDFLKEEHPQSVKLDAVMRMDEYNWKPWGELFYSTKTGENAFKKIFDKNLFQYLSDNPPANKTFHKAMTSYTKYGMESFFKNYSFKEFKSVVDIGGSSGILMKNILERYPFISGIVFDLPEVKEKAEKYLIENKIDNRCRVVSGDFFKSVPEGCDLYILKKIIHDWDDEKSVDILKNCCKAARPGSRILLMESVIMQGQLNSAIMMNDIHMLVQTDGGMERTEEEYDKILNAAGFDVTKITERYAEGVKKK
jgi:hypothetical protein